MCHKKAPNTSSNKKYREIRLCNDSYNQQCFALEVLKMVVEKGKEKSYDFTTSEVEVMMGDAEKTL